MSITPRLFPVTGLAAAAVLALSCDGPAPAPPPGPATAVAPHPLSPLEPALGSSLVHQVRYGPGGPAGQGYARWVEEQLVEAGGTLLYADWGAAPADGTGNEVHFDYTMLDSTYRVRAGTFVWRIDGDRVEPPRHLRSGPVQPETDSSTPGGPPA
jgi:hypothetical protein